MWRLVFLLLWVGTQYIRSIGCPGEAQKLINGQRTGNTITTATTNFLAVVVVVVLMLLISTLAGRFKSVTEINKKQWGRGGSKNARGPPYLVSNFFE
jgi:hypothetical protein